MLLQQFLIKELKTKKVMSMAITEKSDEYGNNDEGNNNALTNKHMILTKFNNIGSIRRNVELPFLFDYNQTRKYLEKDSENLSEALSEISNKRK